MVVSERTFEGVELTSNAFWLSIDSAGATSVPVCVGGEERKDLEGDCSGWSTVLRLHSSRAVNVPTGLPEIFCRFAEGTPKAWLDISI